jgi:hypothetical protein
MNARPYLTLVLALVLSLFTIDAGAESVSELAKKLRGHEDFLVRAQAALALGATQSKKAIEPLCSGLSDDKDSVRAAAAAGLAKLALGGKECLDKRLAKENSSNVRKMIEKALRLIDEAGTGPTLGKSTKYYVALGRVLDRTGRKAGEVASLVRSAMLRKASSLSGFAFAPSGETIAQAKKRLRKHDHVYGYLFEPIVTKSSSGGNVSIELDVKFFSYPEREALGNLSRTVGMSGSSIDTDQENDLIKKVSTEAMSEFARMAAQID